MGTKSRSKPRIPKDIWFRAGEGSRYTDEDAKILGPALAAMVKEHQGELSAADIVEEARSRSSVFHDYIFADDDKTAAARHREELARGLVRSIYVCWSGNSDGEPVEESTRLLRWVVVPAQNTEEEQEEAEEGVRPGRRPPKKKRDRRTRRLVTVDEAVSNAEYVRQMIETAKQDLKRCEARYRWFIQNLPRFKRKFKRAFDAIRRL